jgi:NAD(P)H dehydrogenase (quinone)
MKIGIIVHSFTGNTLAVAEKIQSSLLSSGHEAVIERLVIAGGEQPNVAQFLIEDPPDESRYDALIFGAPVRGFSISPVISAYLKQLTSLKDKKVACFVTKQLNSNWTGGKSAIDAMTKLCESKGGSVAGTGVVFWKSKNRDHEIDSLVQQLSSLF